MDRTLASTLFAALILSTAPLAGCLTDNTEPEASAEKTAAGRGLALSADDAIARARKWVDVGMPYCGGVNGGHDVLCDGTCVRTGAASTPEWDAYRSDCSGLVSYAWGLPAPGRVTSTLPEVANPISGYDLAPGDILNNDHHVVLFSGWLDKGSGKAQVIHEPDCGKVATELTVWLGLGDGANVSLWGEGYTALRYVDIESGGGSSNSGDPGGQPPAKEGCGDLDYTGACDGTVLRWCEDDAVKSFDCAARGAVCGWQSDDIGNNCL